MGRWQGSGGRGLSRDHRRVQASDGLGRQAGSAVKVRIGGGRCLPGQRLLPDLGRAGGAEPVGGREQAGAGWGGQGRGWAQGLMGGLLELGHDLVEEPVDLVHLVTTEGGLEPRLLDLFGGEGELVARAAGAQAVTQTGQVGGGPFEQAANLAPLVPTNDPAEGPRPDLLGREPAFGHGARFPVAWAVMATSSVLLDRVGWQTGTTGQPARFLWWPSSEEVPAVRRTRTILILVAVAAVLAAGCAGGGGDKGEAAIAPAAASSTSPRSASGDADTDDVRIVDFAFVPRTVRAKVGQKVKWEHQDAGVTHTVTALDRSFRSGDLEEGDEFSHLFPTAGTFAYRCSIHPDMRGRVKVSG